MKYEDLEKINQEINKKGIDVKGKQYVQVNDRVIGFRKLYPEGTIETETLNLNDGVVVVKTKVSNNGLLLATGLAYERENSTFINKTSYIENAETSAVGRALGMLGIGIDTALCSADEVVNAINNQHKNELVEKFKRLLVETDTDWELVKETFKVNDWFDMTETQLEQSIKKMESKK